MSMANLHCTLRPKKVLGLTATPFRTDRIKLCFDKVIRDAGIHQLIQDGYLGRYHHFTIPEYNPTAVAQFLIQDPDGMTKAELSMEEIDLLVAAIGDLAKELGTKRMVMDSITSVCYKLKTSEKIRDFILKLGKTLSDLNCTSILVGEVPATSNANSSFGVEEAIADGIILMANMERRGDLLRTLPVIKMRGTMHSRAKYVLDLTPMGVLLVPLLKGGSTG